MNEQIDEILEFWFGLRDEHGRCTEETKARWWKKSPEFDSEIRERFEAVREEIAAGGRKQWLQTARGCLAYVIALDQFSRNMYRDTAKMYSADPLAVTAARIAIEAKLDQELDAEERGFLYMPFMHSEKIEDQDDCVKLSTDLDAESGGSMKEYAVLHRNIVARFARFPHRNHILGRESSEEEIAFLKEPGSSF